MKAHKKEETVRLDVAAANRAVTLTAHPTNVLFSSEENLGWLEGVDVYG